jgi:hypothetical protein
VGDGTTSLKSNQGLGSSVRESFQELNQSANAVTYIAIIIAMMGALMFGIDQGNYGLVQDFHSFYDYWCKPYYLVGGFDNQAIMVVSPHLVGGYCLSPGAGP